MKMKKSLFVRTTRPKTLGDTVLAQIKETLLNGKLMPGEQISLRSTATALGVSVMPVREAVKQLVAESALEVTPNRAVRVPKLTHEQFTEITQIRLQVEGFAVEQACQKITLKSCQQLETLNQALADAMATPTDTDDLVSLNKQLHFMIYEASDMPMLVKIIESLWLRIGPILNYDLHSGSKRTQDKIAVGHHDQLIQGLRQRDAKLAKAGLHNDIRTAYEHISQKEYAAVPDVK